MSKFLHEIIFGGGIEPGSFEIATIMLSVKTRDQVRTFTKSVLERASVNFEILDQPFVDIGNLLQLEDYAGAMKLCIALRDKLGYECDRFRLCYLMCLMGLKRKEAAAGFAYANVCQRWASECPKFKRLAFLACESASFVSDTEHEKKDYKMDIKALKGHLDNLIQVSNLSADESLYPMAALSAMVKQSAFTKDAWLYTQDFLKKLDDKTYPLALALSDFDPFGENATVCKARFFRLFVHVVQILSNDDRKLIKLIEGSKWARGLVSRSFQSMNTEAFFSRLMASPDACRWLYASLTLLDWVMRDSATSEIFPLLDSQEVGFKSDVIWFANVTTAISFASDADDNNTNINLSLLGRWFAKSANLPARVKSATGLPEFKRALDLMTLVAHFGQIDQDGHCMYGNAIACYDYTQYEMAMTPSRIRYFLDVFTLKFEAVERDCEFNPLAYLPIYAYVAFQLHLTARQADATNEGISLNLCPLVAAISKSLNSDFINAADTLKKLVFSPDFSRLFVSNLLKIATLYVTDWTKLIENPLQSYEFANYVENLPIVSYFHLVCRLIAAGGVESPFAQTFYAVASDTLVEKMMVQNIRGFQMKELVMHHIDPLVFIILHADANTRNRWLRRRNSQCEKFGKTMLTQLSVLSLQMPEHLLARYLGPFLNRVAASHSCLMGKAPLGLLDSQQVHQLFFTLVRFVTAAIGVRLITDLDRRCFALTAAILLAQLVQLNKEAMELYKSSLDCSNGKLTKAMRSNLQYLMAHAMINKNL